MQVARISDLVRPAVMLLSITALVYIPSLGCGFIWDDDKHVTENQTLRSIDGLRRIWTEPQSIPQYYPLVHTSYWIEYHLWELRPIGYHVTNVLLHGLGAILLWRVMEKLEVPGAWVVAAIFAVHPVQAESVAWVTERKNVLAGVFYFGALLAYLGWRPLTPTGESRHGGWKCYVGLLVLFLGALLSKTVTASLPAAILVLVWWKRGRIGWRDVVPLMPMFVVGVSMGLFTAYLERHHVGAAGPEWDLSMLERSLIAGRAVWFYAGKLLWPHPLIFTYPRWQIDAGVWWQYLFPAAAIIVSVLAWLLRDRIGRGPLAGLLLFGGTLFPALGFVNVYPMRFSFVADHFQYLASPAMITLVVVCVVTIASRRRATILSSKSAVFMSAPLLLVLGSITWTQQAIYREQVTLWTDTVTKNPAAWMAYNNRGGIYQREQKPARALPDLTRAIELNPDYALAYSNWGKVYEDLEEFTLAINDFGRVIELEPDNGEAYFNRGVLYAAQKRYDLALQDYATSIALRPQDGWVYNNIAWLLATCPNAKYRNGEKAVAHALRACELSNWRDAGALDTLAAAYAQAGNFVDAINCQRKSIDLAPMDRKPGLRAHLELYKSARPYRSP